MRKAFLAVFGIAIVLGAIFLAKFLIDSNNRKRPTPKKVIKSVFVQNVQNGSVPIIIPANGNLTAKRRVEIFSEVQGIFRAGSKLYKPGQPYSKGQVFINIDNSEYNATVQSAKSNLYNSITAIMADLRLDFPDVYPKWKQYLDGFDLSKPTPELPEMSNEKENFFISGRGIVSSYYNVKNLEQRLTKYSLTAPFNGILVEALVTEGTLIRNGQKLGEFIDPGIYEMEVAIGKSFANLLDVGEKVELSDLENTQTYTGKVSRVNGNVDATTQTITAFIEVKNKNLKEGMFLQANLQAKSEDNAFEISRSLLQDGDQIFVVRDTILDLIDVKPVYFSDTNVVLKNIPDGTSILSKPIPGAYAGMQVKPISEEVKKNQKSDQKTK
jgi:multidrug efflux pump subunit AcrA (membrane-fusion protein)